MLQASRFSTDILLFFACIEQCIFKLSDEHLCIEVRCRLTDSYRYRNFYRYYVHIRSYMVLVRAYTGVYGAYSVVYGAYTGV